MDSIETRLILCKVCNIIKKAFLDSKYPDGKDKRWRDEQGKLFNGKLCPVCHSDKVKEHIKKKRLDAKAS